MMAHLEFHDPVSGRWCPAEPLRTGPETGGQLPRDGTKHLSVTLPDGRTATRSSVAHENHQRLPNVLAGGRCAHCGAHHEAEPDNPGRVYRGVSAPREIETEPPAAAPEPETIEDARKVAPRTTKST